MNYILRGLHALHSKKLFSANNLTSSEFTVELLKFHNTWGRILSVSYHFYFIDSNNQ